jgi:uncharacterized protein (TIGR03437 family)
MRRIGLVVGYVCLLGSLTFGAGHSFPNYQVVNGWAVAEGDILLGREQEIDKDARGVAYQGGRWTNGVIPYVLDPSLRHPEIIVEAMQEWSSRTSIRFVRRTNEPNFIRVRPSSDSLACSATIGMKPGENPVFADGDCGFPTIVHELGHVIGLYHENTRVDRDRYIEVLWENIRREYRFNTFAANVDSPTSHPYDFGSIMHYSAIAFNRGNMPTMRTKPEGIPIGWALTVSALDAEGVDRMYGAQPKGVTISANPEGVQVLVDGRLVRTPVTFDWKPGETHTLSVQRQDTPNAVYDFGTWSDGGAQTHTIVVTPERSAYVVNMIRWIPIGNRPASGGTMEVAPRATAGLYLDGSVVTLAAKPNPGYFFTGWRSDNLVNHNMDRFAESRWTMTVTPMLFRVAPSFSTTAPTIIESNLKNTSAGVEVDGEFYRMPVAFDWKPGESHRIRVDERFSEGHATRRIFTGWSDDWAAQAPGATRTFVADGRGATLKATYRSQYQLAHALMPAGSGRIRLQPASPDGFYDEGATVTLTADPSAGYAFVNWTYDLVGTGANRELQVLQPTQLMAHFSGPNRLGNIGNAASAQFAMPVAGSRNYFFVPGLDGSQPVEVWFDGKITQTFDSGEGWVEALVPANLEGREVTTLEITTRQMRMNPTRVGLVPAAPAFYNSWDFENGVAAVNEDEEWNSPDQPARAGSRVLLILTGHGTLRPEDFRVRIGSSEAEVLWVWEEEDLPGVAVVEVVVPDTGLTGEVPIVAMVKGERTLPDLTISVK